MPRRRVGRSQAVQLTTTRARKGALLKTLKMEIAIILAALVALAVAYRRAPVESGETDAKKMTDAELLAEVCHLIDVGQYPNVYSREQDRRAKAAKA